MGKVSELWRRVGMLVRRGKFERELEEEMRLHRELKEKDLIAEGRGGARGAVCGEPAIRECLYLRERGSEAWGWRWLKDFVQDARFGARMLWQNPGLTIIAVTTLALGIGVNTAVFTLFHAVMLKELPVTNPSALYRLGDGAELAESLLNGDTIRQKLDDDDLCFLAGILDSEGIPRDQLCISLVRPSKPGSRGKSFRRTSRNRRRHLSPARAMRQSARL